MSSVTEGAEALDIQVTVNGRAMALRVPANTLLIDLLRDDLGLTGTKLSCASEVCGACTVLVDGEPVSACTYLALETDARSVTTVEGLADGARLSPLQQAFLRHGALQCGYCTPGQLTSATALLRATARPTEHDVTEWMRGNVCRCGAYVEIRNAILDAAAGPSAPDR